MRRYRIANLLVDSAVAIPGAAVSAGRGRAWRVVVSRGAAPRRRLRWHLHERAPGGHPWRSVARDGDCHVVRFWRAATFELAHARRRITCFRHAGTSLDTLRQLLVGHVLPLVFVERGALALHASAVRGPGGVLAFIGDTGQGKSTIAAALARQGCPLVADDCAIVEVGRHDCRVRPMHVGLRLWPDAMRAVTGRAARPDGANRTRSGRKRRVTPAALGLSLQGRPARLHRVYLIAPAGARREAAVDRVRAADAVVALLAASFQLGLDRPEALRRSFQDLSALVAHVPVRRLTRPRGLRSLPALMERVLEDAAR